MVTVRANMDTRVVCLDASETVMVAIKKMIQNKVWSVVVTKYGLPEGVVTERDIIRRCVSTGMDPRGERVERIMSSPLITIDPDASMREALDLMNEKNIRRVYAVEDGKIIGRVTQTESFRFLISIFEGLESISRVL